MERSFGQDTQPQKITILGGNSGKHHARNDKKLEVSEKPVYQFTIVYHIKKNWQVRSLEELVNGLWIIL